MSTLLKDLQVGFRSLRKRPGFALTVALTLGLGIGAATAIFSVVHAVLIRPLPYADADRVMTVWGELRARSVNDWPFANPDFADLRAQAKSFEALAAITTQRGAIPGPQGDAVTVRRANATVNIFKVLGLKVARGRDFADADGMPPPPPPQQAPPGQPPPGQPPPAPAPPPPPPIAIISHEFWQRFFGGDERVVGNTARLGNQTVEIIGVLAPGAELLYRPGTNMEQRPDVWTPMRIDFTQGNRNNVGPRVLGRLKPGVTVAQAQAEVDDIAADLRKRFSTKQTAGLYFHVQPIARDLVANVRPLILALMGAVMFVLLIACANVANLLLARSAARERELAVRAALGAGRGRLIRQLLSESVLLAAAGAVIGLVLASLGIRLLLALQPDDLPRLNTVAIDPVVISFASVLALVSAVIFGLVPAIRSARPDVVDVLRKTGRTAGLGGGTWLRSGVVVAEVVLSFVLLIGLGLMVRSFIELQKVHPGFDAGNVLTFRLGNFQIQGDAVGYVRDLAEKFKALPGVESATCAAPLPLDGGVANARYGPMAAASDESLYRQATTHFVMPGYFETMKTRVLQGRTFTDADMRQDALYIVIDDIIAARLFPGDSPIGKPMLSRIRTNDPETFEIIGVVQHQRHTSYAEPGREGMFFASALVGGNPGARWAVRAQDPVSLVPVIRAELAKLPGPPLMLDVEPMSAAIDRATAGTRFALVLIGIFAFIAVVLAAVGLYSVLSTIVRQRTAEIGVRMAFGAGRGSVFRLVVGKGMVLSGLGVILGLVAAYLLTGVMRTMLVGVTPTDPATFVGIAALFLGVTALASGIPALRAARLDPIAALREE
jgi:putative ABC transport system permease protein